MLRRCLPALALLIPALSSPVHAQPVDPALHQELEYRLIGPFRASRTVGGVGVPSQPGIFYGLFVGSSG